MKKNSKSTNKQSNKNAKSNIRNTNCKDCKSNMDLDNSNSNKSE